MIEAAARAALVTHLTSQGQAGVAAEEFPLFTKKATPYRPGGFYFAQTGRADLAFFGADGPTAGYEIKTSGDSLARLPKQVPEYLLTFDLTFLVVAQNHLKRLTSPDMAGWQAAGILLMEEDGAVSLVRDPVRQPEGEVMRFLLGLWREELLGIALDVLTSRKTALKRMCMYSLAYEVAGHLTRLEVLERVRDARVRRVRGKRSAWCIGSVP